MERLKDIITDKIIKTVKSKGNVSSKEYILSVYDRKYLDELHTKSSANISIQLFKLIILLCKYTAEELA